MLLKIVLGGWLGCWLSASAAALPSAALPNQGARVVSSGDIAAWGLGLIVVLGAFCVCVWGLRKLGGINATGSEKIRMVSGLSLGLREKIMVLQVGKKQLVLGVTPGRIETLLVLEGEDCLKPEASAVTATAGFSQKLAQALKGNPDA